jgi:hypothetical protein
MSNIANQIQLAIQKEHERRYDFLIPKGMCVCILDDGDFGFTGKRDEIPEEIRNEYLGRLFARCDNMPDGYAKNHCTGNFIRR